MCLCACAQGEAHTCTHGIITVQGMMQVESHETARYGLSVGPRFAQKIGAECRTTRPWSSTLGTTPFPWAAFTARSCTTELCSPAHRATRAPGRLARLKGARGSRPRGRRSQLACVAGRVWLDRWCQAQEVGPLPWLGTSGLACVTSKGRLKDNFL